MFSCFISWKYIFYSLFASSQNSNKFCAGRTCGRVEVLTARLAAASRLIRIAAFVQVRNKPGSTFHAVCLSPVSWGVVGAGGGSSNEPSWRKWGCFRCSYPVWDADVSVTGIQSFQTSLPPPMLTVLPQPAPRSPSSFVAAHLCAQRGGAASATEDRARPRARPHAAPALMRCSCFQIQPLILILFHLLNMAPKGTSVSVVFCVGAIVRLSGSFRGGEGTISIKLLIEYGGLFLNRPPLGVN